MSPDELKISTQNALNQFEFHKETGTDKQVTLILHDGVLKCVSKKDIKIKIVENLKGMFSKEPIEVKTNQVNLSIFDAIKSLFKQGPRNLRHIVDFCNKQDITNFDLNNKLAQSYKTNLLWHKFSKQDQTSSQINALIALYKDSEFKQKFDAQEIENFTNALESLRDNKPISHPLKDSAFATIFCQSIVIGYNELAAKMLSEGTDVNCKGAEGMTPLHAAAISDNEKFAKILISRGADFTTRDTFGRTPFLAACVYGNEKSVAFLLKNGPMSQLNDVDNEGKSAIQLAKVGFNYHIEDVIENFKSKHKVME